MALKEIFLKQDLQLLDPISTESKETTVYGGFYLGEEVAVKVFVMPVDDLRDAISAYGAFKVECEKTMILSRADPHVLQVRERLESFDLMQMENMVHQVARKEFHAIEIWGAILGVVIGLAQAGLLFAIG